MMRQHDAEEVSTAAVHKQGASQKPALLQWHVTALAALAVLCTAVLAWASVGGHLRRLACSGPGLQALQSTHAEPPDNATFVICLNIRLDADDPQWVDGRAEDLHEVSGPQHW